MVPRRGIILIIQILVVLRFFLTLNYSSKSSISSIPSAIVNKTQSDISTPHATTHHCPPNLEPTCSNDWILDGFDSMRIHGFEITTFKQSNGTFTKNSTELKLCHFSNESQRAMNYNNSNKGSMMLAGVLPSSGVLLKCNNALIEFRTKRQLKGGIFPTVTCGHPLQNNDTTNSIVSYNVSAVLGTDIFWPWTYQHAVKDGLGLSAMIWNHVKDVPNLHVLVGDFNELWYFLRGEEHAINAPVEQISKGGTMWFRHLYIGTVPSEITPSEWLTQQPTKDTMSSIQKGKSNLLPCSLSSMVGFQKWRAEFSSSSNQEFQSNSNNNTLLYLQRLGRSGTYRMGNFVFFDCSGPDVAASCNCTSVSEDDFIQRLDLLSRHLGLTLEVFRSDNRKKDAETFAKAKVVIGPHGGAFTNIIFLDPLRDPIIIESNLHQDFWSCCQSSLKGEAKEPPRHFFDPLAAALGFRYVVHNPNIWEGYGFDGQIRLEINEYLKFVENTVRGIDTDESNMLAPFHPCAPSFY